MCATTNKKRVMLCTAVSCNKDPEFIPPVTTLVILTNGRAPYSDQWRASKQPRQHHMTHSTQRHLSSGWRYVHFMLRSSPTFCLQNILLCNKNVSTNIYGDTTPQKYFSFSKFWVSKFWKFWAPLFWGLPKLTLLFGAYVSRRFYYLSCFLLHGNA